MRNKKEIELFERSSIDKAILDLALPTVVGQIILVIYNMADTFFIGRTANDAMLAAVTVCMPAFMFLSAVSNLFGVGGASVIARAMGERNDARAGRAASFAFWGCLLGAAVYSTGAFLTRDIFINLLGGADPAVHAYAVEYLTCTVVLGGTATATGMLLAHLIRAEGRAVYASAGIALGGVANILLDPLFMFVILPPGRETLGAAIATVLSNVVSLVFFIAVLARIRKKSLLSFRPSRQMLCNAIPGEILGAGIPACVMTLFENISYAALDKLMSLAGLEVQAGIGVAKKVNMMAHCIVRGISQGALPLIAYNYASKNHARMKESIRGANRMAVLLAALCMAVSLALSRQLVGIFIRHETPALSYGAAFLRILCVGAPFSAAAYTYISFFQAVGEGRRSFFLAILRKGIVDIPLMFLLGGLLPVYGSVAATPIADALCCLAAVILFRRFLKRMDARLTGEPGGAPAPAAAGCEGRVTDA